MNTAPLSCETFKLFSSSRNQVCEEFKNMTEEMPVSFRKQPPKGIPFDHIVMFNEPEAALESITKNIEISLLSTSESVEDRSESRIEEGERLRSNGLCLCHGVTKHFRRRVGPFFTNRCPWTPFKPKSGPLEKGRIFFFLSCNPRQNTTFSDTPF